MYKVLIVDDEPFILEGIKYVISWDEHGLNIVGTAKNGMDALNILDTQKIDIVITDIRMPKMDGLELIRTIRQRGLNVKIIILSGYSEFEYAKQAARLGIENYILKPIDEEELSTTLLATIEKIEFEQSSALQHKTGLEIIRENIFYRWVSGTIEKEKLKQRLEMIGLNYKHSNFISFVIKIENATAKAQYSEENCTDLPVLNTNLFEYDISDICKRCLKDIWNNTIFTSINEDIVMVLSWDRVNYGYDKIIKLFEECIQIIEKNLNIVVQGFLGSIVHDYLSVSISYNNCVFLMQNSSKFTSAKVVDWDSISSKISTSYSNTKHNKNYSALIRKVVNHIDTFYCNEISLKTLSASYDINAAYLGRLFKTETGEMFTNYLNTVRIEKAKNLLIYTDDKINDIADKVGYTSANYFYYIFKKHTGGYPTEYQKKYPPVP